MLLGKLSTALQVSRLQSVKASSSLVESLNLKQEWSEMIQ